MKCKKTQDGLAACVRQDNSHIAEKTLNRSKMQKINWTLKMQKKTGRMDWPYVSDRITVTPYI